VSVSLRRQVTLKIERFSSLLSLRQSGLSSWDPLNITQDNQRQVEITEKKVKKNVVCNQNGQVTWSRRNTSSLSPQHSRGSGQTNHFDL